MFHTRVSRGSLAALVVALAVTVTADSGADHKLRSDQFGTSGGNVNDITRAFCCSGTLGALVSDGLSLYVLSNNHVLARTNQGQAGEEISQPGLIDNACRAGGTVGHLTAYPSLGTSNVDAAVAELVPGTMDSTGSILDIGVPSSTPATPAVGMGVAKSGRTTGLTTGTIGSTNTDLRVQYQQRCGSGKKFTITYTDQVVINSSSFSAGGDSGSLIVTNTPGHQPVALLYAGSSTTTIGNPIGDVLTQLSESLGRTVSFDLTGADVGPAVQGGASSSLSAAELERGNRAKANHGARLMSDPSVLGVGVGEDPARPGQAALIVYISRGQSRAAFARELDGVPTHVVETDPIVAFGWNQPAGEGCSSR